MQAALLVVLIGVWIVSAWYDPVFVNELRDLVEDGRDRSLLSALRKNVHLNRTTKKAVVNEILELQDERTQEAYATRVQEKKQLHKAQYDKLLSKAGADQAVKDYLEQAEKINNDMAIKDDDARTKMKELRAKLNRKQRKFAKQMEKFT
ncbi:unnamed protein product [Cylicocyclus nassatus]|uniref:Uncharacterized protein n=1 Tax=Cylicocyclus nassatus TaxID=53992 RepID=A0AA36MFQ6_CYLNA|nr:unnamed protein product [Cylicocyclus nassatus]